MANLIVYDVTIKLHKFGRPTSSCASCLVLNLNFVNSTKYLDCFNPVQPQVRWTDDKAMFRHETSDVKSCVIPPWCSMPQTMFLDWRVHHGLQFRNRMLQVKLSRAPCHKPGLRKWILGDREVLSAHKMWAGGSDGYQKPKNPSPGTVLKRYSSYNGSARVRDRNYTGHEGDEKV